MPKYVIVCRAPGYVRQESPAFRTASVARAELPRAAGYYTARGYKGVLSDDRNSVILTDRAGLQFGVVAVEEIPGC